MFNLESTAKELYLQGYCLTLHYASKWSCALFHAKGFRPAVGNGDDVETAVINSVLDARELERLYGKR